MRRFTITLALAAILCGGAPHALAQTPAATCRTECAPRVAEQCAGRIGRERRQCRRPLLRACRQTTPAVACESTAGLTRALAGHAIRATGRGGDLLDVALCDSGRFTGATPVGGAASAGTWAIALAGDGLVLELTSDANAAVERFGIAPDDAGGVVLDDAPAALDAADATTCAAAIPPPVVDPTAQLVAVARALADRSLRTAVLDLGNGGTASERNLTLCSSGAFTSVFTTTANGVATTETRTGQWTVTALDGRPAIDLAADTGETESLPVTSAPRVTLAGVRAAVGDARAACAAIAPPPIATPPVEPPPPADPVTQFTEALRDQSYFLITTAGTIPVRNKIGLCGTGRHLLIATAERRGPWTVELIDDLPVLVLRDDAGATLRTFKLTLDADGAPLLDGSRPLADTSFADAACA